MASGASKTEPQSRAQPASGKLVEYEQFIQQQINRARSQVKLVDVVWAAMALAAGILTYLLALALIDHWIVGLHFWSRLVALLVLVGGSAVFAAFRVLSPLLRPVNPVFAARAIERSEPGIKNSLINFLLLRTKPGGLRTSVLQGLQRQAAADLSRTSVDAAIDRSHVVRVGLVLAVVVGLCCLYKLLSPKDPFQTVARVAAPWHNIQRPSRVQIQDLQPGDRQVYQGRHVEVSAIVHGARGDEPVTLYYSTVDGQVVDQAVALQPDDHRARFRCVLPDHAAGIQQDLVYRLEAGDAVTGEYRLTALAAPSIVVRRVDYTYPSYTARPPETVQRQGDIKALEGTRVTICADANQPIKSAYIEFDPDEVPAGGASESATAPASGNRRTTSMKVDGEQAEVSFTLVLLPDRQTPRHASYQLRFVTLDDQLNQHPVRHRIEVTPDLPPLVEILSPTKREIDVREDDRTAIELRAVDPDFELARLSLTGVVGGEVVLDEVLLDQAQSGQAVAKYDLVPRKLGLAAGDVVVYWGQAEDNRTAAISGQPEPNTTRTANYKIRIVAPPEAAREPTPADDATSEAQPGEAQQQPGEAGEEPAEAGGSESSAADQQQEGVGEQTGDQTGSQEGMAASDADDQASEEGQAEGAAGDQTASQRTGDRHSGAEDQGQTDGEETPSDAPAEPVPSDGTSDGDAIERILDHLRTQPCDKSCDVPCQKHAADGQLPETTQDGGTADDAAADPQTDQDATGQGQSAGGTDAEETGQPSGQPDQAEAPPADASEDGDGGTSPGDAQRGLPRDQPPGEGAADAQREPGSDDTGESGAGQGGPDDQGTPQAQGENREHPKDARPDGTGKEPDPTNPEPESPSISPRQSDSEGGKAGDRSGGGQQGGGQGAQQQGNDTAGSNRPSEEGAGAAEQTGEGEASSSAGQDQQADRETGQTGDDVGEGSAQRPPSGNPADQQPGSSGDPSSGDPPPDATPAGSSQAGEQSSLPTGGGQAAEGSGPPSSPATEAGEPGEEAANVEYAKKATDLALEHLKQQQEDPDQELLDRLGWTREDVQKFLRRWEQMQRDARQAGEGGRQARQELDDTLRSLGLHPPAERVRSATGPVDQVRGLREAGGRTQPPADYLEQYKAYLKSTARSRESAKK